MFRKNPTVQICVKQWRKEKMCIFIGQKSWGSVVCKWKKNALTKFAYAQFAPSICNQALEEEEEDERKKALKILLGIAWHA